MSESPPPATHLVRPRLLVSVRAAAEAEAAVRAGADLVDAKDPARGALGALPPETVCAIVARVAGRAATSAVAGDPEEAGALAAHVSAMAATGVGWVKVAIGPAALAEADALRAAARAAPGRLIAVLFAEDGAPPGAVPALAAAGFLGAMIDTAGKEGRRLTDIFGPARLAAFTAACRSHGLVSGLAGSLRVADVPDLSACRPDYLGFRGGLCRDGNRTNALDPARIAEAACALRDVPTRDAA